MEVIIFEKEAYYKMLAEVANIVKNAVKEAKLEALSKLSPEGDWISTAEAKALLGVKSKTKMQQLRDTDSIKISKHGRIIKYSRSSILEFLNKNSNEKFHLYSTRKRF